MKKKVALLIASIMLLGSAYSFVGCDGGDTPPETPSGPVGEAERFEDVKGGMSALLSYAGAFTMKSKADIVVQMPNEIQVMTTEESASFDPETKRAYTKFFHKETKYAFGTDLESEDKQPIADPEIIETSMKIFEKDGIWYKSTQTSRHSGTFYAKVNKDYAYEQTRNEWVSTVYAPMFYQLAEADLSTMKSAYEQVYAEQLAKEQETVPTATATANVAVSEADGVTKLSVETYASTTRDGMGAVHDTKMYFTAKDGRLTGTVATEEMQQIISIGDVSMTLGYKADASLEITYEFDETDYADIYEGQNSGRDESNLVPIQMEFVSCGYTTSTGYTLVSPNESAKDWFGSYAGRYTCWGDVETVWYTDEACATPLDLTDKTVNDIKDIKKLYGVSTPKEGFALIVSTETYKDIRSDKYKHVLDTGEIFPVFYGGFEAIEVANQDQYYIASNADEVWVNGVKRTDDAEVLMLEAGRVYEVVHVNFLQDSDEDIFMLFD